MPKTHLRPHETPSPPELSLASLTRWLGRLQSLWLGSLSSGAVQHTEYLSTLLAECGALNAISTCQIKQGTRAAEGMDLRLSALPLLRGMRTATQF